MMLNSRKLMLLIVLSIFPIVANAQVGFASWYGPGEIGMRTASGQTFEPNLLTAASRSLPLGTIIKITNIKNNKKVYVKVNDRGPWHTKCILDVSEKAAKILGMIHSGIARVKIQVIDYPQ